MQDIAKLVRNTPISLLQSFFAAHYPEVLTGVGDVDGPLATKALLANTEKLGSEVQADLRADAERLVTMADEFGDSAMQTLDLFDRDRFEQLENSYARSVWLFMNDQTSFRQAEDARYADYYRDGRIYDGFTGPALASASLDRLGEFREQVAEVLGCNGQMQVEHFTRLHPTSENDDARLFQMSVFHEGYPDSYLAFEGENITRHHRRPVYEVIVTYDAATGVIEVYAAQKDMREDIARLFCEVLLKTPMEMERVPLRSYHLGSLLTQRELPVDAADGIESVRITSLKMKPTTEKNSVTLQVSAREERSIFDVSKDWFQQHNPLENGFIVQQAVLAIKFYKVRGQGKARVLPVKISNPNGCNLKGRTEKERMIGEKYLKAWGLVRDLA
jgi:hypothetical protein